jgi:hypothetical protein
MNVKRDPKLNQIAARIGVDEFARRLDWRYWLHHRYLADSMYWTFPDEEGGPVGFDERGLPIFDDGRIKSHWVTVTGVYIDKSTTGEPGTLGTAAKVCLIVTCETDGTQWTVPIHRLITSFPEGRTRTGFRVPQPGQEHEPEPVRPVWRGDWAEAVQSPQRHRSRFGGRSGPPRRDRYNPNNPQHRADQAISDHHHQRG